MGNKSSSPGTKEQWDKLKILLWGGPGQDFDILAWDRPEQDGTWTFCHRTGPDRILTASSIPSQDRGVCLGIFAAALVQGTPGQ